jgi:hypothetical protein
LAVIFIDVFVWFNITQGDLPGFQQRLQLPLSNFRRQLWLQIPLSIQSFGADISLTESIVRRNQYAISRNHLFILQLNNVTHHQLRRADFVMLQLRILINPRDNLAINPVVLLPSLIISQSFEEHSNKYNPRNGNNTDQWIISRNRRNALKYTIYDEEDIDCILKLLE